MATSDIIDLFLFLYCSWAFVRIGRLERHCERLEESHMHLVKGFDRMMADLWKAFREYIEEKE